MISDLDETIKQLLIKKGSLGATGVDTSVETMRLTRRWQRH